MKEYVEKVMEFLWYNPKKALAAGIAAGAVLTKIFKKGLVPALLLLLAGKIYIDAEKEQRELTEEEF